MNRATTSGPISLQRTLARSEQHLADYLRVTTGLSREMKGIRRSEMFFLYASVADMAPARILESGRARAQSTLVLSLLFPQASIISIELDAASPDVAVAAERLKTCQNVECRFGDSRILLPEMLQPGDVVIIDGPKDFRAVKLALRLLRTGKPAAIFLHDLWLGSPVRRFVDRHVPGVFLSDHPEWVCRCAGLDSHKPIPPVLPGVRRAYGATLACFTPVGANYRFCLFQCGVAQRNERLREILRKVRGRAPRVQPKDFAAVEANGGLK